MDRSKVSRPDGADLNLLSAIMMSGDGSALQTTKASSGIWVAMPRYSRSSTAFKTIPDVVGIPAKANTDSEGNANGIPGRRRTALGA